MANRYETVYSRHFTDDRKMDLFIPDQPNGSCLLFIHGGGWSAGSKAQWHSVAQYFCNLGYVCASADYRLAPATVFPGQIEDVRLAMQFIKRESPAFGCDPNAVVAVGSSAGGHLAAMLATISGDDSLGTSPELENRNTVPRAVVCYCPVTTLFIPRSFVEVFMGATAQEEPDRYRSASPVHRVQGGLPPFLFIQGDQDPTTTLQDTSSMCHAINRSGGTADLAVLPGVKHGFGYGTETPAQKLSLKYMELFLAKNGIYIS